MFLKILEEENIHVIIGLGESPGDGIASVYAFMNRLAVKHKRRRFTLHVFTPNPKPYYFEKLRDILLNNIAYTIVVRYYDLNVDQLEKLAEEIHSRNDPLYGVVYGDLEELRRFFDERGIPYEKIP